MEINGELIGRIYEKLIGILPKLIFGMVLIILIIVIYNIISGGIKKILLRYAKDKKSKNNVMVFMNLIKYLFYLLILIGIIFLSTGSLAGFGLSAGLLTAALGWALQRPITGIAAWIMVITKKPFQIGDRIMIGDFKGDVEDINLTHIYLAEVGGTVASEEKSGRITMIPNSILFEQRIINYTLQDEFILDEVATLITFESNVDKAIKIVEDSAKEVNKDLVKKTGAPFVRTFFSDSGIKVSVRYYTDTQNRVKRMSDITQRVFRDIKQAKDIEIAYPHTVVRLEKNRH